MSSHQLNSAFTARSIGRHPRRGRRGPYTPAYVRHPPDPIALSLGPLNIGWYGLCYAIGLAAAYLLMVRLARIAGEDPDVVGNGIIIVAVAALIGGRLYHVIDQWHLYADDPIKIVLPPYSGRVYGGILTGTIGVVVRPPARRQLPALGRHNRAGAIRHAGHRPLGQLLQPGAIRPADDVAVGDPDRMRPSARCLPMYDVARADHAVPPAVPV